MSFELFKNFIFRFRLRNISQKEASVSDRNVDFEWFSSRNFVAVILKDALLNLERNLESEIVQNAVTHYMGFCSTCSSEGLLGGESETGGETYSFRSVSRVFLITVRDKCVTAGRAGCGVHHETEVPDLSRLLEKWNKGVLEYVRWDVTDVDLEKEFISEI